MRGFPRAVIGLGLVVTLSLSESFPAWADGSPTLPSPTQEKSRIVPTPAKLDLSSWKGGTNWAAVGPNLSESFTLRQIHFQASGGGGTKMSGAKKTWIIVGIVVGAAVVIAAIRNRGNDNNNGGGGGGPY